MSPFLLTRIFIAWTLAPFLYVLLRCFALMGVI